MLETGKNILWKNSSGGVQWKGRTMFFSLM